MSAQDVESPEWAGAAWKDVELSLDGYTGVVRLRFSLMVDQYIADKGWIFDNVMVKALGSSPLPPDGVFLPIILKN